MWDQILLNAKMSPQWHRIRSGHFKSCERKVNSYQSINLLSSGLFNFLFFFFNFPSEKKGFRFSSSFAIVKPQWDWKPLGSMAQKHLKNNEDPLCYQPIVRFKHPYKSELWHSCCWKCKRKSAIQPNSMKWICFHFGHCLWNRKPLHSKCHTH